MGKLLCLRVRPGIGKSVPIRGCSWPSFLPSNARFWCTPVPENFSCGMKFSTCGMKFFPRQIFFIWRGKFFGTRVDKKRVFEVKKHAFGGKIRPREDLLGIRPRRRNPAAPMEYPAAGVGEAWPQPFYSTIHSQMPPDQPGWSRASMRRAEVVTGVKLTSLKRSGRTP
jgi:hypothetical protein